MRELNIAISLAGLFLFATNAVRGQASAKLEFEVASVKPMPPSPTYIPETKSGGPGTTDPGQITWSGVSLHEMLETAYDVKPTKSAVPPGSVAAPTDTRLSQRRPKTRPKSRST